MRTIEAVSERMVPARLESAGLEGRFAQRARQRYSLLLAGLPELPSKPYSAHIALLGFNPS